MCIFALPVILLASLVVGADAACTAPSAGDIIVDASGQHSNYRTIGEAVGKLNVETPEKQTIFIYAGTYSGRVVISNMMGPLVLQGYTCDTMSYSQNKVTITYQMSQLTLPPYETGQDANELASTLSINTDNVQVYNLNIVNTAVFTPKLGQAPALCVVCNTCAFYACNISGHQDTLYAKKGHQLYARSLVAGTVDFIFGNARAFFYMCDIESVGKGYISANGRATEEDDSYFVFNKARVFSSAPGKVYLGRPWKLYARALFEFCDLSENIDPAGWTLMGKNKENSTDTRHFSLKEYKNTGLGSAIKDRVYYSGQLDNAVDMNTILGDDHDKFVNTAYL
ncbi:unnamed protein product [Peronospora destructor]|uniref:Pectinesterase n=1 Tax=Peronospora destructor TaxID=86335 RepID=A0AAV0V0T0_9STRA|nr:unnamed protein product [Peronospora destructor]